MRADPELTSQYTVVAGSKAAAYDLGVEEIRFASQTDAPTMIIETVALIDAGDLLAGLPQRVETIAEPVAAQQPMARVTGSAVNLREGPSTSYSKVGVVRLDDMLELTGETEGDWVQIVQPLTDTPGWMHGRYLEKVDETIISAQN